MRLIGKAIKHIIVRSEAAQYIGKRFYNSLAPRTAAYPLIIGRVVGVNPVQYKNHPNQGKVINDTISYRITVWSFEPDEAAEIASKVRKALDRIPVQQEVIEGISLSQITFQDAEESPIPGDDRDVFSWDLDFTMRVNCATEDL